MSEKKRKIKINDLTISLFAVLYFSLLIVLAVFVNKKIPQSSGVDHLDSSFFGTPIAWYAIFILSGIVVAAVFAYFEFKRAKWNTDILMDALLIFVPLSIVCARLFYVFFSWIGEGVKYSFADIINIRDGGLAIHGVIIGVFIGLILFTRRKKISYWGFLDMVIVGLFIGQIMGRWGNFMNHEAYGPAIQSEWVLKVLPNFIVNQMTSSTNAAIVYHPTFLYEGIWNFIGLVIVLLTRRKRITKVGDYAGFYLIWYGLGRGILIEPFRQDPLLFFGVRVNVWLSLTLLLISGIVIIVLNRVLNKDQMFYADLTSHGIYNKEEKVGK